MRLPAANQSTMPARARGALHDLPGLNKKMNGFIFNHLQN